LINLILNVLQKYKTLNTVILNNKNNYTYATYIIITTGTSITHIKHISKNISVFLKKNLNINTSNISGKKTEWIIIDLNDIVIHVMSKEIRKEYDLEKLFNEKYTEDI
jgi:ribosome-associated protein